MALGHRDYARAPRWPRARHLSIRAADAIELVVLGRRDISGRAEVAAPVTRRFAPLTPSNGWRRANPRVDHTAPLATGRISAYHPRGSASSNCPASQSLSVQPTAMLLNGHRAPTGSSRLRLSIEGSAS
ncbi:hypothetical protein GCM10011591_11910 [Nocardia camponoti]|uniref:Uncharacterized protein n=1 Tax=Nocardia camponoti TaxID=1616106 RepID=A0A917QBU1_9NOCA|nr:hypothetical protein GCM10011591_11910 [Nocardia camponoti]